MKEFCPYITNDGSVGLYNPEFDDIYHSTFGAYAESCEKFITPSDMQYYITNYKNLNVLDICYGIGYNSKSFLHFYLKNLPVQKHSVDTIHSDNILPARSVYINAIDTEKELVFLSPFFTTNAKKKPKHQNLPTEKVKHLSSDTVEPLYDYDNLINFLLVDKLKDKFPDFAENADLREYLKSCSNKPFLDKSTISYYKLKRNMSYLSRINDILHNIYYRNVSRRYKKALKAPGVAGIDIDFHVDDARQVILKDDKKYHLVFLDAFTPTKCPCLWTLDFFKLLYDHLDDNGRILTYSNSALVRSAFLSAGFHVGKIYNERTKTFTGTIAVKNKDFIKYDLSEYDLSLVKTRAGIFYRDKNLNGLNEAIIACHKKEVEESPLISSSKFIKQYRKEHNDV